jgi:hypothetical protein
MEFKTERTKSGMIIKKPMLHEHVTLMPIEEMDVYFSKLLESEAEPTTSKAPSNTESQGDFVSPPKPQPSNAPPPIRKAARMATGARPKQP